MNFNFFKSFSTFLFIPIIFLILCMCLFVPVFSVYSDNIVIVSSSFPISPQTSFISSDTSGFVWPTPGYTYITSNFGYRRTPTSGASSYHSGIDIGAPVGSNIVSICNGTVTYTGFNGAGGFTVIIKSGNLSISYCHVSPTFLVYVGQSVYKGNIIAKVGPKNVYGVQNNPYKDSSGNPTNGATTGAHLHLTIRKDGQAVNPLNYL